MDEIPVPEPTKDETKYKNKNYNPVFYKKFRSWYLPTAPLWTKIALTSKIAEHKRVESITTNKKFGINTVTKECNTNVYSEQFFRVKKQTTFKDDTSRNVVEFLKKNIKDNKGIFVQVSLSSYKKALEKGVKGTLLSTADFGKAQQKGKTRNGN